MTTTANNASARKPLVLAPGRIFRNVKGDVVQIVLMLANTEDKYAEGFRFIDNGGRFYTEYGSSTTGTLPDEHDLVEELPAAFMDAVRTETREFIQPGFFGRAAAKIKRNPGKTTAVVAGVGVTGYGVYNYRDHGNVLPQSILSRRRQAIDGTVAAANFARKFFA